MSSAPTYSAPPRRAGAAESSDAPASASFSSFGRPPRPDGCAGAGSAGGGGYRSSRSEFDNAAAAAFGKKPARTFDEAPAVAPPKVTPARNTLASLLDGLLPPEPESNEREWSRSALQQQRKAAAAEKTSKPGPKKSYEDEFPTLGGGGSGAAVSVRIPKPVFATTDASETKPVGSFATLAASWAKSEEERKAAEERAARMRLEQQQRDEFERRQYSTLYFNHNSNRQYNNYDHDENNNYDEYADIEGELGEEAYTEKDRRADRRAATNHFSDEEVDEDRVDYNIGSSTGW